MLTAMHPRMPPAELVDAIYDAPLSPSAWIEVRRSLEHRFGGLAAFWTAAEKPRSPIIACSNGESAGVRAYVDSLWIEDAAMGAMLDAPAGAVVRDSALIDDAARGASVFYSEYLCVLGTPRGLYSCLLRDGAESVVLGIHRPRSEGDYDAADEGLMRSLVPHFQRSLSIQRRLHAAQLGAHVTAQALEAADMAVAMTDADGRLRFANAAAEVFLGGEGLTVRYGIIEALRPDGTQALHAAIARATKPHGAAATTFALPLMHYAGTVSVLVSPVRPSTTGLSPPEPLAMLVLGRSKKPEIGHESLLNVYGLTPAEARLLSALVAGERLADYAARSGIALATARTHVRGLLQKTGVRRQTDLIRKALADPVLRMGQ